MKWVKVAQLCPTFCDPVDYTAHGILQARILEWVGFPFSRGSRDQTQVFWIAGRFFHQLSHKGSPRILEWVAYSFSSRSSQPRNRTGVSCIAGGFFTNWAIREALIDPDTPSLAIWPFPYYSWYIWSLCDYRQAPCQGLRKQTGKRPHKVTWETN